MLQAHGPAPGDVSELELGDADGQKRLTGKTPSQQLGSSGSKEETSAGSLDA